MFSFRNGRVNFLSALLAVLVFAAGARAQETAAPTQPQQASVSGSGFRSRIYEVKYRNPESLYQLLQTLGSGFQGSMISTNRELRTVAVRDLPENLAVIEEALRRLDVPEPVRPDIEFRVHILIASNGEVSAAPVPAELNDVTRQLQSSLHYKNFGLMSTQLMRAKDGRQGLGNKGVAELRLPQVAANQGPIYYDYRLETISMEDLSAAAPKVQVGNFSFSIRVPLIFSSNDIRYDSVGFNAPVSLRHGERVVAGTMSMQDKSVVVVLSGIVGK